MALIIEGGRGDSDVESNHDQCYDCEILVGDVEVEDVS